MEPAAVGLGKVSSSTAFYLRSKITTASPVTALQTAILRNDIMSFLNVFLA